MHIGIHLRALRPGKIGGHETYVRQLVRLLPRIDPDVRLTLFCADYNARTFTAGPHVEVRVLSAREFAALDAESLRRHRLDVWFCPLLVLEPHEPGLPAVVNIPDLQHETFPEFFSKRILDWRKEHYPRSARRADGVLTHSGFSRRQIIEAFDLPADKVHAIHLDAAPGFSIKPTEDARYLDDLKLRYQLPDHFLYYPANNWPHKNHAVLFEALRSGEPQIDRSLHLVLTGAEVEGAEPWASVIRASGLEDRVRYLGYLPAEDLPGLYALSRSLVFPSLFEGFGMPVVEAMRAGCPVICSTAAGLSEVGGDAALYFDPERADELAVAIATVASGKSRELVDAGHRRAERFSWERTALSTLDVLREVAAAAPSPRARPPLGSPPLISIVTPSLQQGRFIERTLKSVLEQGYPRLEYWVIDGGSTDGTLETLERYRQLYPDVFRYLSEPDSGQAEAVNKGLARVRGDIVGWLNSDDTYEAGSLAAVARAFDEHPACDIIYGGAQFISDSDEPMGAYPTRPRFDWHTLVHECYICQPTVFWRRAVTDHGYRLDEGLHLSLDYDFWIRLGRRFSFRFLDRHIANSRVYRENKTLSQREAVFEESFRVVKDHFGWVPWSWVIGRAHFRRQGADSFFNVRPVAPLTYLWALISLVRHNGSAPQYWPRIGRDVWPVFARAPGKLWRRLVPSARRTLKVPVSCLVVELGVEVTTRTAPCSSSAVDLWWAGHHLARFAVNGPGRYTQRINLPQKEGTRPYRLTLHSDLLRSDGARALEPQPCQVVSEDGWLEQRDTLRLPRGWKVVEITFMLPVGTDDGIRLTFDCQGRTVDEWVFERPGMYRRQLRLPPEAWSNDSETELEFASNAALPPQPRRGERRWLAMRVQEIVDLTPEPDEVPR